MFDLKKPIPGMCSDPYPVRVLLDMMENPITAVLNNLPFPSAKRADFYITPEAEKLLKSFYAVLSGSGWRPSAFAHVDPERIALYITEKPQNSPGCVTLEIAQWACYYVFRNLSPTLREYFLVDNPEAPTLFTLNPDVPPIRPPQLQWTPPWALPVAPPPPKEAA